MESDCARTLAGKASAAILEAHSEGYIAAAACVRGEQRARSVVQKSLVQVDRPATQAGTGGRRDRQASRQASKRTGRRLDRGDRDRPGDRQCNNGAN